MKFVQAIANSPLVEGFFEVLEDWEWVLIFSAVSCVIWRVLGK